ncbi:MAG: alanine and proline-rich secreted protein Apa [Gemmataceae bacterium]|nr:alanine and proline-rich secreted protein Apa [Gemmataceae bacterium]MDW8244728.1 hypothetical protein [Thermogemmata sp.]
MEIAQLEAVLQGVEPALRLVSERHLLQVLYYLRDWGYPYAVHSGLPYWIGRADLEAVGTLPAEVLRGQENPLLLITTPDDRLWDELPPAEQLRGYWRLLFQAAIYRRVDQALRNHDWTSEDCHRRLLRWGHAAEREILHVLTEEHMLPEQAGPVSVYRTFAAAYLDLAYFEPERLPDFFPSLPPQEVIRQQLESELGATDLLTKTRPTGAAEPQIHEAPPEQWWQLPASRLPRSTGQDAPSEALRRQYAEEAAAAAKQGNWIRAAIRHMQRAEQEPSVTEQSSAHAQAQAALQQVVTGLGRLWNWDELLQQQWLQALRPLLPLAAQGRWPRAARCLYELQKLQGTLQREVYTVDLVEFLRTLGRRPIVRPLPHARTVRQLISLHKARRQMLRAGLTPAAQLRLDQLFDHQIQQVEQAVRDQLAPVIRACLDQAGLRPATVVEQVGREKLIAELLDQICTSGYARFGHLRDAIARNNLKLPDLRGPGEWLIGDGLLRADLLLAEQLDGVYHRGEFYLRLLQRFSALFFGTPWGRWLTLYLALPFGGAFLILMFLEEVRHLGHKAIHLFVPATASARSEPPSTSETTLPLVPAMIDPESGLPLAPPPRQHTETAPGSPGKVASEVNDVGQWDPTHDPSARPYDTDDDKLSPSPPASDPAILWYGSEHGSSLVTGVLTSSAAVEEPQKPAPSLLVAPPTILAVGLFFLLALHVPPFRRTLLRGLWHAGVLLRWMLWDAPRALWRSPMFRSLRQSRPVRFLYHHLWTPTLLTLLSYLILFLLGVNPLFLFNWLWAVIWAGMTLAYNTPWGWLIQDRIAEALADWWRRVRATLLPGLIAVVIDWFHRLVNWVERGLYAVDEWLRYRGGDSRAMLAVKALLGLLWFPIAYAFRFVFYLLVEPQVNPVKHFPVVTVSHKVIWPLVPQIAAWTGISIWTVSMIINGIPGIFGFIAWELKENWRLYAANRPRRLRPVLIGHHGETMRRLLRPGFHSGTLPRCYRKLRQARTPEKHTRWHQELHHVAQAVQRFVDRELVMLIKRVQPDLSLQVSSVVTGCRRVVIHLTNNGSATELQLAFEEIDGQITAAVMDEGWAAHCDDLQRSRLILGLRGLLDAAAVDVYDGRERIELDLPLAKDFDDLRRFVTWSEWQRGWQCQPLPLAATA